MWLGMRGFILSASDSTGIWLNMRGFILFAIANPAVN
jgi:hypothetical protein